MWFIVEGKVVWSLFQEKSVWVERRSEEQKVVSEANKQQLLLHNMYVRSGSYSAHTMERTQLQYVHI